MEVVEIYRIIVLFLIETINLRNSALNCHVCYSVRRDEMELLNFLIRNNHVERLDIFFIQIYGQLLCKILNVVFACRYTIRELKTFQNIVLMRNFGEYKRVMFCIENGSRHVAYD